MKGKHRNELRKSFRCDNPPCIHIVYDARRRIYAVFIEVDESNIFPVSAEKLEAACNNLMMVKSMKLREADLQGTDLLAIKYLGARPVE